MTITTLSPVADNRVEQANPTVNNGSSSNLNLPGKDSGAARYAHLDFDLSGIPADHVCNSATFNLQMTVLDVSNQVFEAWLSVSGNSGWTELGSTWNTRDGTTAWVGGTNGGGVEGTDVEATVLGTYSFVSAGQTPPVALPIPLDAARIQPYFGSATHLHIVAKRQGAATSASSIGSQDTGTVANRPTLVIDHSAADVLTTGALTVNAVAPTCVKLTATASGDTSGDAVAAFQHSTDGVNWTNFPANDETVYSGSTTAVFYGSGLTAGTTYTARATWSNPDGTINGTNPVASAGFTTLAAPDLTPAAEYLPAAKLSFFPNKPNTSAPISSADTPTTISHADYVEITRPSSLAAGDPDYDFLVSLRGVRADAAVAQYLMSSQLYYDPTAGSAGSLAKVSERSRMQWDTRTAGSMVEVWDNLIASEGEAMFLHSASPTSAANRITSGGQWRLNPGNAGVRLAHRKAIVRSMLEAHSDAVSNAAGRFSGIIRWDNWWCQAQDSPIEYASGFNQAWLDDMNALADALADTGVTVYANLTGDNPATDEQEQLGAHLDGALLEAKLPGTAQLALSSATTHDRLTTVEHLLSVTAGAYLPPADFVVILHGQITDTSAGYAVSQAEVEAVLGYYLLSCDATMSRTFGRPADEHDPGYNYFQKDIDANRGLSGTRADYAIDFGAPTATRSFVAGTGTSPDGIWKRTFTNGTIYMNITPTGGSGRTITNPDTGTSLAPKRTEWVAAAAGPVDLTPAASGAGAAAAALVTGLLLPGMTAAGTASASVTLTAAVAPVRTVASRVAAPVFTLRLATALGSAEGGRPLPDVAIDARVTDCRFTTGRPGGFLGMTIGLGPDGGEPLVGQMPRDNAVSGFEHCELWFGPWLLWEGRIVEIQQTRGRTSGFIAEGYFVSATLDGYATNTSATTMTTAAALRTTLALAAPLLSPGNSDQFVDTGVLHAPADFLNMTGSQILDQVMREGTSSGDAVDAMVWDGRVLWLTPRVAPAVADYLLEPGEVDSARVDLRGVYSQAEVFYTTNGVEQTTGVVTAPGVIDRYGVRRALPITADEQTAAGAGQLAVTELARRSVGETSISITRAVDPQTRQWPTLRRPGGGGRPAFLVRADEWAQDEAGGALLPIVATEFDANALSLRADIGALPPSFVTTLRQLAAARNAARGGVNPFVGGRRSRLQQGSAITALTDATGGTAGSSLAATPDATTNSNFRRLNDMVTAVIESLQAAKLIP